VQVKVKILHPDDYLRPEMNASVAFHPPQKPAQKTVQQDAAKPLLTIPASAVRDGVVFIIVAGKALRRPVQTGAPTSQGVQIKEGLLGGEDLIVNPPAGLQDGQKVQVK